MIKTQNYIVSLICLLVLTSCSYNTQTQKTTPYFDGIIKFSGEPVANARVILSLENADTACMKATKTVHTNDEGQFSIKAVSEQKTYKPFVNYTFNEWNICAVYKDKHYLLYSNNRYDTGSISESIFLECELTHRRKNSYCKPSH